MENKLIILYYSDHQIKNGIKVVAFNADFTLGNISLLTTEAEFKRLMNGGNMDRLTKEQYK